MLNILSFRTLCLTIGVCLLPLLALGQGDIEQLSLRVANDSLAGQSIFLFHETGQIGIDGLDAFQLNSLATSYVEIFSQDTSGSNLAINTLPIDLQQVLEIPVFVRSTVVDTFDLNVNRFENIQPNWELSLIDLRTGDTLAVNDTTSARVFHTGTPQSGVLTIQHFTMVINPGIVTQRTSIAGTPGRNGWRFLGSPFSDVSYARLLDSVWTQGATGSDLPSGAPHMFTWNESAQSYEVLSDLDRVPPTGSGFITYLFEDDDPLNAGVDGGWPKSFHTSGIAGFGTQELPVTYTSGADSSLNGFNLVANPYPFSIDWNAPSGWTKTNIQDAVWIWDPNASSGNGDYLEHISGVGDAINVIAPNQAFWVRATAANPALTVTESVQSSDGALLKKRDEIPVLTVRMKSEESGMEDIHYVSFREDGASTADAYDMTKLPSLSADYMSLYALSGEEKLAVNNLPSDFTRLEIPIQVDHSCPGNHMTLSLDHTHPFFEEKVIRFFDEKLRRFVEMDTSATYTFQADSGRYAFTMILEKPTSTSGSPETDRPGQITLSQNYPNPFNPATVIAFEIPERVAVTLEVFDVQGRKVATLLNGQSKAQGIHTHVFDASHLSSGIYVYRLQAGGTVLTRKLTLIK